MPGQTAAPELSRQCQSALRPQMPSGLAQELWPHPFIDRLPYGALPSFPSPSNPFSYTRSAHASFPPICSPAPQPRRSDQHSAAQPQPAPPPPLLPSASCCPFCPCLALGQTQRLCVGLVPTRLLRPAPPNVHKSGAPQPRHCTNLFHCARLCSTPGLQRSPLVMLPHQALPLPFSRLTCIPRSLLLPFNLRSAIPCGGPAPLPLPLPQRPFCPPIFGSCLPAPFPSLPTVLE